MVVWFYRQEVFVAISMNYFFKHLKVSNCLTCCSCIAGENPAKLPKSHRDQENQRWEGVAWGTCRWPSAASCPEYRIPPGLWMSSCWGSYWSSRTGRSPGPHSYWGSPWSRYPQCPSPNNTTQSNRAGILHSSQVKLSFLSFTIDPFPIS